MDMDDDTDDTELRNEVTRLRWATHGNGGWFCVAAMFGFKIAADSLERSSPGEYGAKFAALIFLLASIYKLIRSFTPK